METQNAQIGTPHYLSADDLILTAHFEYHMPTTAISHGQNNPAVHQSGQAAPNGVAPITMELLGDDFAGPAVQKFTLVFELTCPLMETTFVFADLTLPNGEWLSRARWAEFVAAHRARQEDELEFDGGSGICTFEGDAIFYRGEQGGKIETALAGELCFEPFEQVSAELENCENASM